MDKEDRATAARRKRREDPVADRAGKGGKPINVQTEEYIEEKNAPTNPALWSRAKSLARSKFDVYPSAYANGWASKWYKSKGGGWKSVSEEVEHIDEVSADLLNRYRDAAKTSDTSGMTNTKQFKRREQLPNLAQAKVAAGKSDDASRHILNRYKMTGGKVKVPATEETINEISDALVGRANTLRRLGPDVSKGTAPTPHKTAKGAETLAKAVDRVRNNSKVGAPPMKEDVDSMFAEKFGKEREAVARSGQEPKDKDLVMRSSDRKTSDKGYRTQSIVKQVIEAKDKGEYDYEGDMAMSQLRSIMHNAQQINDMLKPNTNMPEWVQSKITLAADYISTCADYLQSNEEDLDEEFDLLSEAADKMVGTIGSDRKGLRHLKNYVMPYLSAEGRKKTANSFAEHGTLEHSGHGEHHDPKATHNFTLATKQGGHAKGTPVKVTHVSQGPNNSLIAHTEKHGSMPMGALYKPESLKKPAITREGFGVEGKIAENLGTKAAGSTKHGYDFHYGTGEHEIRGKVKEIEPDKKTGGASPTVRGESKLDKGKMGQSTLKHTKEKGWHFTNAALSSHMEKAQINGKPILDHLNEHHSDGKIDRAYTIPAPKGMAQHYLKTSNVNTLHLHNKKEGHGTTFTIGDKNNLKGKTKLGHLSHADLERLNGTITIEKTTTGSTQAAHRPKHSVMKELANMSKTNSAKHRDLTNKDHAEEFKQHINKMNEATTTANLAPYEGPMKKIQKVKNVAIRMANGKIKSLPPGKSGSSGGGGD
jgi:hypothetical protein